MTEGTREHLELTVRQAQKDLLELQERLEYLEFKDRQAREEMQARAALRDGTARRVQQARLALAVAQGELESLDVPQYARPPRTGGS